MTSAQIPEEDTCHRARNLCVFSRIQKGTPRLTDKGCVLQRVFLDAISDLTVVLGMRQSIDELTCTDLNDVNTGSITWYPGPLVVFNRAPPYWLVIKERKHREYHGFKKVHDTDFFSSEIQNDVWLCIHHQITIFRVPPQRAHYVVPPGVATRLLGR